MLSAALFDLDGTLLDSNAQHVRAWSDAFERRGYRVAADRIAVEVGKGGDQLVPDLLGREAEANDGDALRKLHDEAFAAIALREGLRALPGAEALLAAIRARELRLALATSSNADGLAVCERASGIAWRSLFDVVADADAAKASKPAPDIVAAAVAKLGVSPAECVMIGDTPWDARAAKHAGVVLLGVRSGGNDDRALRRAGARGVYRDAADIAAHVADALTLASPGATVLTHARLDALVQQALEVAADALAAGEAPIGAVIARGDGEVVARGWNRFHATGDRAAHAEIEAFRAVAGKLAPDARDTILVSTLEPCVMCLGAAMETAVDTVVYGLRAAGDSGTGRVTPPESADNQMPRIVGDIRAADARALFAEWLARPSRDRRQEPFIRSLLAVDD